MSALVADSTLDDSEHEEESSPNWAGLIPEKLNLESNLVTLSSFLTIEGEQVTKKDIAEFRRYEAIIFGKPNKTNLEKDWLKD